MSTPETDTVPIAHPGADFDVEPEPSTLVLERRRVGLPTRKPGTPNRVRFVAGANGLVAVFEPEAGR